MRALTSTARNIMHSVIEGEDGKDTVQTTIEAVLTVMTRGMSFSGAGIIQTESLDTVRFEMTITAAKKLIHNIQEWVDTAENERTRLTLRTST